MSTRKDLEEEFLNQTRYKRLKILKRKQYTFPHFDNRVALEVELRHSGYFKIFENSVRDPSKVLDSDLAYIRDCSLLRMFDCFNMYNMIVTYIKTLNVRKQRQLNRLALSWLRLSLHQDTNRVGASVRAIMTFQQEFFGMAGKMIALNPGIAELCDQGFGKIDRGISYDKAGSLNGAARESDDDKRVKASLTVVQINYPEIVAEEFDIFAYLIELKMLDPSYADIKFDAIPERWYEVDGEHVYQEAKSVARQQFEVLMEAMDRACKAFDAYCNLSKRDRDSYQLPAKPAKVVKAEPKPVVVPEPIVEQTPEIVEVKEERMNWRDLTEHQRRMVNEGKATFVAGQFEMRRNPAPAPLDLSWAEKLLTGEPVREPEVAQMLEEAYNRVAAYYAKAFPENESFVKALLFQHLDEGHSIKTAVNALYEIKIKKLPMTHKIFSNGVNSFRDYIPLEDVNKVNKHRDIIEKLRTLTTKAELEAHQQEQAAMRKAQAALQPVVPTPEPVAPKPVQVDYAKIAEGLTF